MSEIQTSQANRLRRQGYYERGRSPPEKVHESRNIERSSATEE
jgi:hypothetical protein